MKLATRFILLFILLAIPVIALSSHFASQQFVASIQDEHREIIDLMRQLEQEQKFKQAIFSEDMVYFHEVARSVSDYAISIRIVSLGDPDKQANVPNLPNPRVEQYLRSGQIGTLTHAATNRRSIHTYFPIQATSETDAFEIASSLEQADKLWVKTWLAAMQVVAALGLIGLAVFLLAGSHWIGKPLRAINEKMRRVGQGDFSNDLHIDTQDEFGQLAHEINRMCDRLQTQQRQIARETDQRIEALEQLRHAERLVTVGQLAAGLAHEMGTPLNVVAGRASMILNDPDMGETKLKENALAIKNEAMRISSIVQKGLDYSRQGELEMVDSDLRTVVGNTVDLLQPIAQGRRITIRASLPDDAAIARCDPDHIQQVLMNLVTNAFDAVQEGQTVTIGLTLSDDRKTWQLTVADQGKGIPGEIQERLFEPFFTTKDAGFGTGLGLSIVKDIVEEHRGTIRFTSQPGQGTTFLVQLPATGF